MINAQELRLGNWVDCIGGKRERVNQLRKQAVRDGDFFLINSRLPEHILPIKLTPELVEKAGFEKTPIGDLYITLPARIMIVFMNGKISQLDLQQDGKVISFRSSHVKYVHQLQNIYYTLTQEELTINL